MAPDNTKTFEIKLGKAGLVILVFGMAIFLCIAFLFGVDVGKNIDTYPNKIASIPQKALALVWKPAKVRLEQNEMNNKIVQSQPQAKSEIQPDQNVNLTFHNALTSKKGVSNEQPIDGKQTKTPPEQPVAEPQNSAIDTDVQKKHETKNDKIALKEISNEKMKETPVDSKKQQYIIQAASLKEKNNADEMNKKISSLGFKTKITKIDVKGKGVLYRVVVTGFEYKDQAQAAAKKIAKKTGSNCIIKKI